jgi:hypothetical protein
MRADRRRPRSPRWHPFGARWHRLDLAVGQRGVDDRAGRSTTVAPLQVRAGRLALDVFGEAGGESIKLSPGRARLRRRAPAAHEIWH